MQEEEEFSAISFLRKDYAEWCVEEAGGGTKNGKVMAGLARRVKDRCR